MCVDTLRTLLPKGDKETPPFPFFLMSRLHAASSFYGSQLFLFFFFFLFLSWTPRVAYKKKTHTYIYICACAQTNLNTKLLSTCTSASCLPQNSVVCHLPLRAGKEKKKHKAQTPFFVACSSRKRRKRERERGEKKKKDGRAMIIAEWKGQGGGKKVKNKESKRPKVCL